MHRWSLISVLLVCTACTVRVRPPVLGVSFKTKAYVEARVVQAQAVPQVVVPIQGATVVEFFGIPLEGVQDVVFVLDCSGSMEELARGRIAELANTPPPSAPPTEPPSTDAPPTAPPAEPPPTDAPPTEPPAPPAEALPVAAQPVPAAPRQPRKIDVAQAELIEALERLPPGTRMNVVFFNNGLEAFAPTMVALQETGKVELIGFVRETEPTGRTALAPAMRTAFLMNARRIVLLSDGLGNVGGNAQALLRDAREAMRGGVRIDTIGLGADQDVYLLQTLAGESGGLYQAL